MYLSSDPILRNQIDDSSCVIACIAMALDLEVGYVADFAKSLDLTHSNGIADLERNWILSKFGILTSEFQNISGVSVCAGSYIATVPSLNFPGKLHSVFVYANPESIQLLDPQNGRGEKKYYERDSFFTAPITGFTRLFDESHVHE